MSWECCAIVFFGERSTSEVINADRSRSEFERRHTLHSWPYHNPPTHRCDEHGHMTRYNITDATPHSFESGICDGIEELRERTSEDRWCISEMA